MYKKGTGNDKQGKDAGNRTLCPYINFSQAIMLYTKHTGQERPISRKEGWTGEVKNFGAECWILELGDFPQLQESCKFWSHDITWLKNLPLKSQPEQIGGNDSTRLTYSPHVTIRLTPGVNFASVHGLAPITVHMSFSLPWGISRGGLPFVQVQHPVTRLAEVIFLHVNRTQKLPQGKSSLAHAHY